MRIRLEVGGMSCQHCVAAVKKSIESQPGVSDIEINLSDGSVFLEADEQLMYEKLKDAITEEGYELITVSEA